VTYTIKSGDTLSKIASNYSTTSTAIYNLNKTVIGSDPNKIEVGMILSLPTSASSPLSLVSSTPAVKTSSSTGASSTGSFISKIKAVFSNKYLLYGSGVGAALLIFLLTMPKTKRANPKRKHRKG
jgi:lysozyme